MIKGYFKVMALSLVLLFALTACASAPATGASGGSDLMAGVKAASWPAAPEKLDGRFVSAVSDFSWSFFREASQNKGNVLVSPASVYLALGMALNGADGATRDAMLDALRSKGLTDAEINSFCRDWMNYMRSAGKKTELAIADSIWYRDGYQPDQDYLQRNADFFGAGARRLDFSKPEAIQTINGWVKDATKGTIEKIIDKIDPDVMMYLINAIYFKSVWQTPFDGSDTYDGQFNAPAGPVDVKYMKRDGDLACIDQDGVKGVILPYDDGRFSFVALLPQEGRDARAFIASLDGKGVSSLIASARSTAASLTLPKFEVRFEDSLINEMQALGMGVAFDSNAADFSRMSASHKKELFISEIRHKTFCRVDELGTEASAVTSVEMKLTAMPIADFQVNFDRSFVYGIVDSVTGAPLFLGVMEDPSAK